MNNMARRSAAAAMELLLAAALFLLHYTDLLHIGIFGAEPMLLLPFLVSYSMFREELHAAIAGALTGFFADGVASGTSFLHTIFFFILCFAIALATHYLLNNNLRAAVMLSLVSAICYYLLRWLCFFAFTGSGNSIDYLMQYALPSVIYTALFIFPLYFLQRAIYRMRSKGEVK